MNINNIREVIRRITNHYQTNNPEELIRSMGIQIDYLPNYTDINKLQGCYSLHNGKRTILIHPDLDDYSRREVLSHELGHAILHTTTNAMFLITYTYFRLEKFEIEADTFASELLIDDSVRHMYPGESNKLISQQIKVSKRLVDIKMNNIKKYQKINNFSS